MEKVIINSFEELEALTGKDLGVSEYHQITQEQINKFADATLDHQWIHVDVEKAKTESQFGSTIAHGYLTISILPHLWNQIVDVRNLKMQVNYGIEKFKFNAPVVVDSKVRLHAKVNKVVNLRGNIIPVIDLRKRFGLEKKDFDEETRIIIVNVNELNIGMVVDSSSEVLQLDRERVDAAPSISNNASINFVKEIGKSDGRIVMLIDLKKVLGVEELELD